MNGSGKIPRQTDRQTDSLACLLLASVLQQAMEVIL